ncbi:hypothetical protein ACFUPZ_00110 [Microbacterium oxydans]|uniref:hypothetical protein n=1 Tax=Microbacterium oxydans TaxID=82380 RepID=UPI0036440BAC
MVNQVITKPSAERVEQCRESWERLAKERGWLGEWEANGKRVMVWHDASGNVIDSIYLNQEPTAEDIIVLDDDEQW